MPSFALSANGRRACPPEELPQSASKTCCRPELPEASYTQWEYFFARHFNRRDRDIYVANDECEAGQGRRILMIDR